MKLTASSRVELVKERRALSSFGGRTGTDEGAFRGFEHTPIDENETRDSIYYYPYPLPNLSLIDLYNAFRFLI